MTYQAFGIKIPLMKKIILASNSPRRREILAAAGIRFEVIPSEIEENITADSPEELVKGLSLLKCTDVAKRMGPGFTVIGADTIVVHDGQIMGKPKDGADAFNMLKSLKGDTHAVYTGVTVIDTDTGKEMTFNERCEVRMFDVSNEAIRKYIETGEPMDKAGAYAIQGRGAFLVERINGDFYTVMGLPIARLMKVLYEEFGLKWEDTP